MSTNRCPNCTHATQYPDGVIRCDVDECKPKEGKFKLYKIKTMNLKVKKTTRLEV